jgi:Holliday junction DNA helicase RuvA
MIGYIKGRVQAVLDGQLIIEGNGIGWLINTSAGATIDEECSFYIHTHMNEGSISLWGFKEAKELKLFKKLIDVSGVGPKTASLIISQKGYNEVILAIKNRQATALKVSGVGPKTAEKIVIELKDKFNDVIVEGNFENSSQLNLEDKPLINDVKDALRSLGYSINQINEALLKVKDLDQYSEQKDLIKQLLKLIQ